MEYLRDNPEKYWFRRKLFGWGWTPATWQGWALTAGFVAIVVALGLTLDENATDREAAFMLLLPIAILTAIFIRIAYKTGEPPRWTWGFPKEDDENTENEATPNQQENN